MMGAIGSRSGSLNHTAIKAFALALVLVGIALGILSTSRAQSEIGTVYVVEIQGEIDLGLVPYLGRVLADAREDDARAVILEINTPGGRLDAALQMRDAILGSPTRTIAFVNREAFSAGALIAISAQDVYMAPGAVMGAATPVEGSGETASEKVVSAVRTTFKSTAETRKRDPAIAEAMVDPSVEIEGLVDKDRLLTLTSNEAQKRGYADGVVSSREALLEAAGLEATQVISTRPGMAENLVRFLTNPVVASLLVSLGLLLLIADALTEGFGAVGAVGLGLLATFFWGHYLAGLAGWEGVALVVLGLGLIGLEVFVIPGFGFAGILGTVALAVGLFISLISGSVVTNEDLTRAGYTVGSTFLFLIVGAGLLLRYLPSVGRFQGLVLQSQVGGPDRAPERSTRRWRRSGGEGPRSTRALSRPASAEPASLVGATGLALSDLRPGGFAQIGRERVDVVTKGDYIRAGESVEVIADEGYRRVVRRLEDGQRGATD